MRLDRPVNTGSWPVPPHAEVSEGWVRWPGVGGTQRDSADGLLDDFLDLADATAADVTRFVTRWGPLGLCAQHGEPVTHTVHAWPWSREVPVAFDRGDPCDIRRVGRVDHLDGHIFAEPADGYRRMAKFVRGLLVIAAELHRGRVPDSSVWEAAGITAPEPDYTGDLDDVARLTVGGHVWSLLELGRVRVSFHWQGERPEVHLRGAGSVLGPLAIQAAFAVSRSDGLAVCVGCGRPYTPTRRPREGQRTYCPQCRDAGVPQRHAARDYYRRSRGISEEDQDG